MDNLGLYIIIPVLGVLLFFASRYYKDRVTSSSILATYSRDLTTLATEGKLDPVVGRKHEIERVLQILTRRTKNNPVLIGDSGVGKTAIVEELANKIARGDVPETIKDKKLLQLDLSGLVAGTKYRGEFEKRLKDVVNEIVGAQGSIIIFIDEIHSLAEAGEATGAINAADILKPALSRGQLQAVGATTAEDYKKYIENDPTLERRFQPVIVDEPDAHATIDILRGIRSKYEEHHNVRLPDWTLKRAVELADKYLPDRSFPDKAIDLIDEASSKVRLHVITDPANYKENPAPEVTPEDIEEIVSDWTNELVKIEEKVKEDRTAPEEQAPEKVQKDI